MDNRPPRPGEPDGFRRRPAPPRAPHPPRATGDPRRAPADPPRPPRTPAEGRGEPHDRTPEPPRANRGDPPRRDPRAGHDLPPRRPQPGDPRGGTPRASDQRGGDQRGGTSRSADARGNDSRSASGDEAGRRGAAGRDPSGRSAASGRDPSGRSAASGREAGGRGENSRSAAGHEARRRGATERDAGERGAAGREAAGREAGGRGVTGRGGDPRSTPGRGEARPARAGAEGRPPRAGDAARTTARAGAEGVGRRPNGPARAEGAQAGARPRPTQRPPARRTAPRREPVRSGNLVGRTVVAFFSVAVLLGTGYAWANFQSLANNLTTTDVIGADGGGERPADGSIDILMVGMDARTDAKGNPLPQHILDELQAGDESAGGLNTDTIILMHIPNDTGKAVAVSFPRDSYVKIAGGYGRHKINSAYGYGKNDAVADLQKKGVTDPAQVEQESKKEGAKNLIQTVQDLTGVTIDHYAEINLVGFYDITKAVGGVDVCLNQATEDDYSGANFAKGPQTIQGRDALAFVRQRYGLLRGDLDRIVRQQVFMAGLAKKMLSAGTLSDPTKLRALIDALTKSIVLDKGWDVLKFATQMKDLSGGNIKFETIPTGNPELVTPEDGTAIEINESEVKRFFKNLGKEPTGTSTTPSVDPSTVTVEVRNASGSGGLAGRVLDALVAKRFVSGGAANADTPMAKSVVRYGQGGEAGAQAVADALGGLDIEQDDDIPVGRARVFVGSDYSGPGTQNLAGAPLVGLDGARRAQPGTSTTEEPPITADGVRCVN
nr:hypothetical protein GCM10017745_83050 [Saccharothrix mutabilis subsp. capreolus]